MPFSASYLTQSSGFVGLPTQALSLFLEMRLSTISIIIFLYGTLEFSFIVVFNAHELLEIISPPAENTEGDLLRSHAKEVKQRQTAGSFLFSAELFFTSK